MGDGQSQPFRPKAGAGKKKAFVVEVVVLDGDMENQHPCGSCLDLKPVGLAGRTAGISDPRSREKASLETPLVTRNVTVGQAALEMSRALPT